MSGARRRAPTPTTTARDQRRDRGAVAVEWALGAPIIFSLLLLLLQVFFWGAGYLVAHAAGRDDATQLLHQLGGNFVNNPSITVTRGAATTTITIHGTSIGAHLPITVTIQAPTERYTQ